MRGVGRWQSNAIKMICDREVTAALGYATVVQFEGGMVQLEARLQKPSPCLLPWYFSIVSLFGKCISLLEPSPTPYQLVFVTRFTMGSTSPEVVLPNQSLDLTVLGLNSGTSMVSRYQGEHFSPAI
jgi:hypothetical protein